MYRTAGGMKPGSSMMIIQNLGCVYLMLKGMRAAPASETRALNPERSNQPDLEDRSNDTIVIIRKGLG